MCALVAKLSAVYSEQLNLYERVLGLVEKERSALNQCRPLGELIESFKAKRDILRTIETMERAITAEKAEYKKNNSSFEPVETFRLNETVKTIKQVIQTIMAIEEQNEEILLAYGRFPEPAGAITAEE